MARKSAETGGQAAQALDQKDSEILELRERLAALEGNRSKRAARDISEDITEGDDDGKYHFEALTRCQIEGCFLEPQQKIVLNPAAANRQRRNLNLRALIGLPKKLEIGDKPLPDHEDPKVGEAPPDFRLVKQA